MNRKKALASFLIVAMLLCSSLKKLEWNRKTAFFVVSIAMAAVLLVIFAPKGMEIAETVALDPVAWNFQRPVEASGNSTFINETLRFPFSNGGLQMESNLWLFVYMDRPFMDLWDSLEFQLCIEAKVIHSKSFIDSVFIIAHKGNETCVDWHETDTVVGNLSIVDIEDGYLKSSLACIRLEGKNNPRSIYAETIAHWELLTPNSESHKLEIMIEVVYFDGSDYRKVVQPFQLNIIGSE